uniref:Type III secretion protein HrpJ n=1 Tax=Pseudomonas sp. KD TaxID=255443 RepID=Q6S7E5_9PSED|nr:type III secretion protein HrpJ [Pseudomonas sp. KD]
MKIPGFTPVAIHSVNPASARPALTLRRRRRTSQKIRAPRRTRWRDSPRHLIQQSKELSQRELVIGGTVLQSKAMKLGELYQMLMGSNDKRLDEAVRTLRQTLKRQRSDESLLGRVLAFAGGDPAKAHVMLQAAMKQAHHEGARDEHQVLSDHASALRQRHGNRARAGINTARAFSRSGLDSQRRKNLRELYYNGVVGQPTISSLIDTLLGQEDGEAQFEPTLRDLRRAIADDLASVNPSSPRQQLRTLMHGVNTAKHVSTLLKSCEHLLGRMRDKNPQLQVSAPTFLKHLLVLSGKGMNLQETLQLTQFIGGAQLKHQLSFLNGLRPMLQQLPILAVARPQVPAECFGEPVVADGRTHSARAKPAQGELGL